MMAIERRPGSIRRGRRLDLDRYESIIEQNRTKIQEAIEPQTLFGRARRAVIQKIPVKGLRERLEVAPLDEALVDMRGSIIDLYSNIGDIMRSGRELGERFNDITEQLVVVEADPNNKEAVRDLRELLRSKAEQDLGIKRDPQTEELLELVLEPDDPEKAAKLRESTIFQAKRNLQISRTVADIGENLAVKSAQTFEMATAEYSSTLEVKQTMNVLHRAGIDLMTAHKLRIQTFNTLTGSLDSLIQTANLATDVQEIIEEMRVTTDAERLNLLSQRADELKRRTVTFLQPPTDQIEKQIEAPKKPAE